MKSIVPTWCIFASCCLVTCDVIAEDFDIKASRVGYNLLWPTKRCCAFDLHIAGDGVAKIAVKRSGGTEPTTESQTFTLSPEELTQIRKLIDDNDFFSLPTDIGPWPVDGDEQRIAIRMEGRVKQVRFAQPSQNPSRETIRAFNVWRGLKRTFKIEGENVERANAF